MFKTPSDSFWTHRLASEPYLQISEEIVTAPKDPDFGNANSESLQVSGLNENPEGLVNKAEAFIAYNSSLRHYPYPEEATKDVLQSRWQALSTALNALTTASKIPSADNLPKIHLARGDTELLRFQLGQPPANFGAAAKNGIVLVKNSEKFYRGAKALATSSGGR